MTVSLAILAANFGTSIISPGLQDIAQDFGVSIEVAILALSLYLIGFCNLASRVIANQSDWPLVCCPVI